MTTETETPRQLAEREAAETKAALNDWSTAGAKCRTQAEALAREQDRVKDQLRAARLAAVAGNGTDGQVAALADRERALEAEIAETAARLAAVTDQIQLAHAAAEAAQGRLDPIVRQAERERVVGLANAADRRVEAAYNALTEALNERFLYEGTVHLNWGSIRVNQKRHPYSFS